MMPKKQRPAKTRPRETISIINKPPPKPLPNYSLSSVCPACDSRTFRQACKVRCPQCGFMWDCSEL